MLAVACIIQNLNGFNEFSFFNKVQIDVISTSTKKQQKTPLPVDCSYKRVCFEAYDVDF